MNLKFYKKLYLDENIEDKDEVINKIEQNINIFNLYLILVSKNVNNTFEILSLNECFKKIYENKDYVVVGMAYGKKQCFLLLKNIFYDNINDINNIKQKFIKNK